LGEEGWGESVIWLEERGEFDRRRRQRLSVSRLDVGWELVYLGTYLGRSVVVEIGHELNDGFAVASFTSRYEFSFDDWDMRF
jgi:hypothetical protein